MSKYILSDEQKDIVAGDEVKWIPVHKSTEYSKFYLFDSNRIVKRNKVSKIKKEIENNDLSEENFIKVDIIDGKLYIHDGQHRFIAWMELEMPVYYIFSKMTKNAIGRFASMQDKWTLEDFLHHYIMEDKHHYKVLTGFRKQYPYPITTLIGLLGGSFHSSRLEEFRMGQFKAREDLSFVHEVLGKVTDFKQYSDRVYRHRLFLQVYCDALTNPEFDHDTFVHKISLKPEEFIYCDKMNDYFRMIENIYNYKSRVVLRMF